MATITVNNIVWNTFVHNGKFSLVHNNSHAIVYDDITCNRYLLIERGQTIAIKNTVGECLEVATNIVLDYSANEYCASDDKWEYDIVV